MQRTQSDRFVEMLSANERRYGNVLGKKKNDDYRKLVLSGTDGAKKIAFNAAWIRMYPTTPGNDQ